MKKILITGANGFIGRNLLESLNNEYNIYCPTRKELDLLSEKSVERYMKNNYFDVVIHSAVQDTLGEKKIYEVQALDRNLRMFFNLEKCKGYYGKMYCLGSGAEYDKRNYIPMMDEGYFGKNIPIDSYGFSKYIIAKSILKSENIYNLRLFGVYGKYEKYKYRFISNSICKIIRNKDIEINQNVYFDYLYIDDLCNIIKWFIENKPLFKSYNLCTGKKTDLITIAKIVLDISGKELDIVVKKDGLNKEYTGNNKRLISEIGNFKFTSLEKSIKELYDFYLKTENSWDL